MPQYTPVRLELISPILQGSDNSLLDSLEYVITIRCPLLNTFDGQQTLPTRITKRVRAGQTIVLKLLPSDLTLPSRKYQVSYAYANKPSETLATEEWIVPYLDKPFRSALDLEPQTLIYKLPPDFFALDIIKSAFPLPSYQLLDNTIVFATAPNLQKVWIEYHRVLSRVDVLYDPKTWKKRPPINANATFDYLTIY